MEAAAALRCLIGVAVIAGVGRAEFDGQIGSRNPEAMIVPPIDPHICARRHMAGGTPERRAAPSAVRDDAYLSEAWHCPQTPSSGARSLAPCGSWQSLHVTPAANILLLNEP